VGFGKGFAENLVLQRLAPEDALKLAQAIFQLLHLGIADYWLIGIHSHHTSLAQEPAPTIKKIWRNSMPPSRRGNGLPWGKAFPDDLQFASCCPAPPPDVTDHQVNLSKLVRHKPITQPVLEPSCLC
jgi:hypothetical protein